VHHACLRLDLVRACHDDHLVDAAIREGAEHRRKKQPLLGRAETRRLARREDDRGYDSSTPTFLMTIV
jgi:hypothetical protein